MTANFALRVAGAQIPVGTDIKANTANLLRAIDITAGKGADILMTPEGSLSGYTHESIPPPPNTHSWRSPPPPLAKTSA